MSETRRPIKARNAGWAGHVAASLAKRGVRPNTISVASSVFALLAGLLLVLPALLESRPWTCVVLLGGGLCIQCRLLCNLFDGMVAVEGGFKTASGEIFNDFPDRVSDTLIFVGAGYGTGMPLGVSLGWAAAVVALATAYTRILGASAGAGHCFCGPMAKQHRMAVMTGATVLAGILACWGYGGWVVPAALVIICLGCLITLVRRLRTVVRELEHAG